MVNAGVAVAVPFRLRLMPMHFDRRAVDIERDAGQRPAAPLSPEASAGKFQHRLAQHLEVCRLRHQRGEPRQRRLRGQSRPPERREPRRGTGRQPEGRVMAQRVSIVVVPPALRRQQDRGPKERGKIMGHIGLAARVAQTRRHPRHDAAALEYLSQHHRTRISGQPIGPALDPKRTIETGRDRL